MTLAGTDARTAAGAIDITHPGKKTMPYISVKVAGNRSDQTASQIAAAVLENTSAILNKKKELTSVSVEFVEPQHWFIAGERCGSGTSFYLDIKITEGTNTKDQKALYVNRMFAAMESLLGTLHPASYIVVQDVRGDSWGYQGQTQEYRYIQGKKL